MSLRKHFDAELSDVRQNLARMTELVDQACDLATKALRLPSTEIRDYARSIEHQVDEYEVAIEKLCHGAMVLEAPIASDLRFLISAMRISTDLEQIGDLAERVTKRCAAIARHQMIDIPHPLIELGDLVATMIIPVMETFNSGDIDKVKAVFDTEVLTDTLTKRCQRLIQQAMEEKPELIREYTQVLRAIYHLEQIADLCVGIGEEAVFYHKGTFIRHHHEDLDKPADRT